MSDGLSDAHRDDLVIQDLREASYRLNKALSAFHDAAFGLNPGAIEIANEFLDDVQLVMKRSQ